MAEAPNVDIDAPCRGDHDHRLTTLENKPPGRRLISLDKVTVYYGDRIALDNVSLAIHRGEVVTVIGPNGAGKSTLLKALLGAEGIARGSVWRQEGLVTGYVPQRLNLDPAFPMTVKRFLSLPRERSLTCKKAMLARVGAERTLNQAIQELSGGQFQRVLLARALLRKPDLLVLDEPVQGVDFRGQTELYNLISDLHKEHGFGVLMVSHDLHIVMASTEKVVCINRHVCCTGAPLQVSSNPAYRALFGTQADQGLALYHHVHDHGHE